MPQLDPATFAPQLVWLAITFGILYWVLARRILPRIGAVLEDREQRIAQDLDRAMAFKAEADEAIEAYEKALAASRAEAHALARQTQAALAASAAERQAKLAATLAQRLREADRAIAESKRQALAGIGAIAAEVARAATLRLTGVEVAQDAAQRTVDLIAADRVAAGR